MDLDALVHQSNSAVELILNHTTTAAQRADAQRFCDSLHEHELSHEIGFRLLRSPHESGQHFGCQLLRSGVKRRWNGWPESTKTACKGFLLDLSLVQQLKPFVRAKFAEAIVEVVRREWPQRWHSFLPTLLKTSSPDFVLLILRTLADAVGEEQVDLPPNRRKEVRNGLTSHKTEIFTFLGNAMAVEVNVALRREGILLARALTSVYTLRVLLQAQIDEFLWSQLTINDLREDVLLTLCEWATTKMMQKGSPDIANEPGFNRLVMGFANLGSYAQFSSITDEAAYSVHRQISSLLKDFLSVNSELVHELPAEAQAKLWNTLMQLALYPSAYIATEALTGMRSFIRAARSLEGRSYINAKDIAVMCFIRHYKPEGGQISLVLQRVLPNASQWMEALTALWESDQDFSGAAPAHTPVGMTKNAVANLLHTLVETGGPAYYDLHVQYCTEIMNELFQEKPLSAPALDAVYYTTERVGSFLATSLSRASANYQKMVDKATKEKKSCRAERPADAFPVVDRSLKILQTLMSLDFGIPDGAAAANAIAPNLHPSSGKSTAIKDPAAGNAVFDAIVTKSAAKCEDQFPQWLRLEIRRLEYIQHAATLFRMRPDVVAPVLEFVFKRVELDVSNCVTLYQLQRQALASLLSIAKNGGEAMTQHVEALLNKAQTVYLRLSTNQRILLVQSLIAAASADGDKQVRIIQLVLQKDVQAWTSPEMTELVCSGTAMFSFLLGQRPCPVADGQKIEQSNSDLRKKFVYVKTFWGFLHGFTMAIRNREPARNDLNIVSHPAKDLITAIAPNILSAVETFIAQFSMNWLAPLPTDTESIERVNLVRAIEELRWNAITGGQKIDGQGPEVAFPCASEFEEYVRVWLWQLRIVLFKALGACLYAGDGFWSEENIQRLIKLVGMFRVMCPFDVVLFHRFVLGELFTSKGAVPLQPVLLQRLTSVLLPAVLSHTLSACDRYYDALDGRDPMILQYSTPVQSIIAIMSVSLLQQFSWFFCCLTSVPKTKSGCSTTLGLVADQICKMREMRGRKNKELPPISVTDWVDCLVVDNVQRQLVIKTAMAILRFSDAMSFGRAMRCLKVITVQTWSRGVLHFGAWTPQGFDSKLAINCATQLLGDIAENLLRPLFHVLTSRLGLKADSSFAPILLKSWTDFVSEFMVAGKITPSPFVGEIAHCVFLGLSSLVYLYHLQLSAMNLSPPETHLNQCQPLMAASKMLCMLPNTSQEDVERVVKALLDVTADVEDSKSLVRSLIMAAVPEPQRRNVSTNGAEIRDIPNGKYEMQCMEDDDDAVYGLELL